MRITLAFLLAVVLPAQDNQYPNQRSITVTASSGNVEIIPTSLLNTGRQVYIGWLSIAWNTSATVKVVYGTGTNCSSGSTDITGGFAGATAIDLYPGSAAAPLLIPKGNAICLNFSTTVTGGGIVKWAN